MGLGFREAFRAGISFGKDDMVIPAAKEKLVADTEALTKEYEQQYNDGLITQGEKYNKVVDAWAKCSEKVADEMMARIKAVEFEDNGTGIAADRLGTLFRLVDRAKTEKPEAACGIGLAICRKTIERHGGRMWAESEVNKGTTIFFSLPKRPIQTSNDGKNNATVQRA